MNSFYDMVHYVNTSLVIDVEAFRNSGLKSVKRLTTLPRLELSSERGTAWEAYREFTKI